MTVWPWLWLALFASLGPILFAVPLFLPAPLLALAILGGFALNRAGAFTPRQLLRPAPLLVPLFAWAALSFLWTGMPAKTVPDALRAAAMVYAGVLLAVACLRFDPASRTALLWAVAWGVIAASVVVLLDVAISGQLSAPWRGGVPFVVGYSRGAALTGALAVPLVLGLWRTEQRRLAFAVLILGVLTVLSLHNLSAKMALLAAIVIGGAALTWPRLARPLAVVIPLAMLALPLVVAQLPDPRGNCDLLARKTSIVHRMLIWKFAAGTIAEHPVAGAGMNSAKALPPQPVDMFARCPDLPGAAAMRDQVFLMPLHPHNNVLQLWLELGAVGLALGLIQLCWTVWRAGGSAPDRLATGAVLAAAGGLGAVASVSFGMWQSWWLAGALLTVAVTALAAGKLDGAGRSA